MKKLVYLFVIVGLVAMSQQSYAQFKDWGTKFGVRGSILFPENEFANLGFNGNDNTSFDWFKASWLGEAFFGFELTKALELSINGGYGKYAGKAYFDVVNEQNEFETTIIPLHLRFRVHPFDVKGPPPPCAPLAPPAAAAASSPCWPTSAAKAPCAPWPPTSARAGPRCTSW